MKLVLAVLVMACGAGTPTKTGVVKADPAIAPIPTDVLAISELKFYQADELFMHLHADGRLEIKGLDDGTGVPVQGWQGGGTLAADGTLTIGGEVGRLLPDGTFQFPDGHIPPFKLDGAELVVGNKRISIDEHGAFVPLWGPKLIRVEGASDAKRKRTALLIIGTLFTTQ